MVLRSLVNKPPPVKASRVGQDAPSAVLTGRLPEAGTAALQFVPGEMPL